MTTRTGKEIRFNLNKPVPLLFLGDGPDQHTGLARIGRDLALLASSMPEFRVGYLGRGAFGNSKLPWQMYTFDARDQWGEWRLQRAYEDLTRGMEDWSKGVVMTVWDASRLLWFARPEFGLPPELERFLRSERFERWGYFMVDGEGVEQERLPMEQAEVLAGYDRVLLASKWGYGLASNSPATSGHKQMDWLPHPINGEVFTRHSGLAVEIYRQALGVSKGEVLLGCVMANQARKHWPTVLEAVARYKQRSMQPVKLWLHTDTELRYWNIQALLVEYGLEDCLLQNNGGVLEDAALAMRYRACDLTLMFSGGEGFCYPVAESLAVGTPVVAGSYGAHAELMQNVGEELLLVPPAITYVDTVHNVRRAVYDPGLVAEAIELEVNKQRDWRGKEKLAQGVEHLHMMKLGVRWKKWLREGLKNEIREQREGAGDGL